jgi:surface protein
LFKIRFTVLQSGTHPLIFAPDPSYYEVADPNGIPYQPMTTQAGAVVAPLTPTPTPSPTSTPIAAFISQWTTTTSNETIFLPLVPSGSYNFTVNWGDGNTETITTPSQNFHVYSTAGTYTVTIRGQIQGWSFAQVAYSRQNIVSVLEWGPLRVGNYGGNFNGCTNLNLSSISDSLDLTGITSLYSFFENCGNITTIQNINSWDVSSVTNMSVMFGDCFVFNQSLDSWDVSSVTNMSGMFRNCSVFNQSLDSWDVCLVNNMNSMFEDCSSYDQDISSWNVPLIPSPPSLFDFGTPASWTLAEKPNWGASC